MYSSLKEAFEFSWSLFADEHNTYVNIELKNLNVKPHDYQIYYENIDLCHQYGISVPESQAFLHTKRPQR